MTEVDRGATALLILLLLGALSAIGALWTFGRLADAEKLRVSKNRILAHLLEFRLFSDEPRLILRAQRDLVAANASLLRHVTVPSLVLLAPLGFLVTILDAFFAHAPVQPGEATVVTVQYTRGAGKELSTIRLRAPEGIRVETPPVRILRDRQVSWRVRPTRAVSGKLEVSCGGDCTATKSVCANPGVHWLSEERARGAAFILHPLELPLNNEVLEAITVRYPVATVFRLHWFVWFLAGSLAGIAVFFVFRMIPTAPKLRY
jgi:hypothetical protein